MTEPEKIEQFRRTLAQDGYHLAVAESPGSVVVTITADPESCNDCLAPKAVLRGMLAPALGVPPEDIELRYPGEAGEDTEGKNT
ncbi:hypothetical protein F4561_002027 [Lipingzhangella halophila]|uniref:NifU-like protein n=1 Tax=Lipingzhangella halophila TaxID=1783352 RepID=A0A7W7RFZ5_9ACTN|nr:hypothetical protein [Lipingzhangella halophila]MBB4931207.1 hypothetical protein [Lipingzhangella halophila]